MSNFSSSEFCFWVSFLGGWQGFYVQGLCWGGGGERGFHQANRSQSAKAQITVFIPQFQIKCIYKSVTEA